MTKTCLLRSDVECPERRRVRRSRSIRFGFVGEIVVHDAEEHRDEEQDEATGAALHSGELIRRRSGEDREPQMTIGHAVIRPFRQQIREFTLLCVVGHGQHSFDLRRREEMRRRGDSGYFSIVFLDGEPALTDEMKLLHRLQIADDQIFEKPRGRRAFARVVVPNANTVE